MTRRTTHREISCEGVALHAGRPVHARLLPGVSGDGIVFRRDDLGGREIPALYDRVGETRLGTVIVEDGGSVAVVEHLMAAIAGADIDDLIIALALRYRLPAVFSTDGSVTAGGLVSYGYNLEQTFGKTADYVDRILRGEKPSDLPVQQPTKFKLAFNLKTAKALGIAIPEAFLLRADEVIE